MAATARDERDESDGVDARLLVLRLLCAFALGASVLLLYEHLQPMAKFCAEGAGCDLVRQSRWSKIAGIPTPVLGIMAFGGILVLSFLERARRLLAVATLVAGAGAIGFIALQAAVVKAWCVYCMFVDVAAVAMGVLGLLLLVRPSGERRALPRAVSAVAIALGLLAPFLFGQATRASNKRPAELPPPTVVDRQELPEPVAREQEPSVATIVEWLDFECPACRAQHAIFAKMLPQYGERVRLVRKMLPLPMHEHAPTAAAAYCCAEEQRHGEEMADLLMTSSSLTKEACEQIAQRLGLDMATFRECVGSDRVRERLQRDRQDAIQVGVQALPTYYIGRERFDGGNEEDVVRASVERAIAESQGS